MLHLLKVLIFLFLIFVEQRCIPMSIQIKNHIFQLYQIIILFTENINTTKEINNRHNNQHFI